MAGIKNWKGLDLGKNFYEFCRPKLLETVPDIVAKAAFGLVGEGSECFGLDDQYSRDHDFGAAFCIWLPAEYLREHSERLEMAIERLPQEYEGFPSRLLPGMRNGRVGPIAIEDFYGFFTSLDHPPADWREWLAIPEYQLAAATNGEVFEDAPGLFSGWRKALLDFYPRDVWLKKLATRVMIMAQTGQYNLPRVLKRGDIAAAMLAAGRFAEAALSFVFLINRRYMPFYKWAPKAVASLPVLGAEVAALLSRLAAGFTDPAASIRLCGLIEEFCRLCADYLREAGLSGEKDSWLWLHGPELMRRVQIRELRETDLLAG